ncbi:hypothetical protein DSO57_1039312 [Entomophthora muscae]|uniref:Uncharacterized protein n=1 Tax=Entomophthora muscae TaxID=34485 RepID=A0ACC2RP97_9FUNG|nr:hypothetical protein DSO57_1039312 [Entomophthora muscae]
MAQSALFRWRKYLTDPKKGDSSVDFTRVRNHLPPSTLWSWKKAAADVRRCERRHPAVGIEFLGSSGVVQGHGQPIGTFSSFQTCLLISH